MLPPKCNYQLRCRFLFTFFIFAISSLSNAEIIIKDDLGKTLTLKTPAERIISLAPNITELLYSVGAGEKIVGADEYSNYPEAAKKILRVNNHAAANYELILSLKPDLVIAWHTGNGEKIINRLRQIGLSVFVIEPRKLSDIPQLFDRLGKLTGNQDQAEKNITEFNQRLKQLVNNNRKKSKVNVFYQIWSEPLITLNGKHFVTDVISMCGGHNIFNDALPLVPYVNTESVIHANPDVIISGGNEDDRLSLIASWEKWPSINAVKNKHIYVISPDLMQRHSLRILDGAKRLCHYLEQSRQYQ